MCDNIVKKTPTETLDDVLFHLGNRVSGLEYIVHNLAELDDDSDLDVDRLCFVLFDIIDSMRKDIQKAEATASRLSSQTIRPSTKS